jgi:hypothetical protein
LNTEEYIFSWHVKGERIEGLVYLLMACQGREIWGIKKREKIKQREDDAMSVGHCTISPGPLQVCVDTCFRLKLQAMDYRLDLVKYRGIEGNRPGWGSK